jgi:hypothetical protein
VLRQARPVLEAAGAQAVAVLHFLQEHDVGSQRVEAVAHSCTVSRRLNCDRPLWML